MENILVTGATGLLGINLVKQLLKDKKYNLTLLIRENSSLKYIDTKKVTIKYGDITDIKSFEKHLNGIDIVVHSAGAVKAEGDVLYDVNVKGVENICKTSKKMGVKKIIHISSISAIGYSFFKPTDENFKYNFSPFDLPYNHSKKQGEDIALSYNSKKMEVIVINPGFIIGEYDSKPSSGKLILDILNSNKFILPYPLFSKKSVVYVNDVVDGIINSINKGKGGERYIVSGETISFYKLFKTILNYSNRKKITIPIGFISSKLALKLLKLLENRLKNPLPISSKLIQSSILPYNVSNKKSIDILNIKYHSADYAIKKAVKWFKKEGYIK